MIRAQASRESGVPEAFLSPKPIVRVFYGGRQSVPALLHLHRLQGEPTQPPSPALTSSPWSHVPSGLQHPGLHMGLPTETSCSFQPVYLSLDLFDPAGKDSGRRTMPWTHRGQQTWEWMYEPGHRLGHRGLMFGQRVGSYSCSLASQTVCPCGWWRHLRPK